MRRTIPLCLLVVSALAQPVAAVERQAAQAQVTQERAAIEVLIVQHAKTHGLPVELVRLVIRRESNFNPRAVYRGNYGLMQIRLGTARALGYRGDAEGLLEPATNMAYGVPYLAGAFGPLMATRRERLCFIRAAITMCIETRASCRRRVRRRFSRRVDVR